MFKHDFVRQRTMYNHPLWAEFSLNSLTDVKEFVQNKKWEELTLMFGHRALLIAGYYIQRGGDIEEVVSAAMLGLCTAVNEVKKDDFENDNPRGYIVSFIHQYCFAVVQNDTLIPTPRYARTVLRKKQIYTCPLIDASDGTNDDFDIIEFDEIMEKIVESELEREVYTYRRVGYKDGEIATLLGISRSTITRVRSTLYERFVNYD